MSLPLETNKNNISNPLGSKRERYPDKRIKKETEKKEVFTAIKDKKGD